MPRTTRTKQVHRCLELLRGYAGFRNKLLVHWAYAKIPVISGHMSDRYGDSLLVGVAPRVRCPIPRCPIAVPEGHGIERGAHRYNPVQSRSVRLGGRLVEQFLVGIGNSEHEGAYLLWGESIRISHRVRLVEGYPVTVRISRGTGDNILGVVAILVSVLASSLRA